MYPALAVLQAFLGIDEDEWRIHDVFAPVQYPKYKHVLWVGGYGGMEASLIKRFGIPYQEIPAAGVHGVGWKKLSANLYKLMQGFFAARNIILKFKPDIVFFTGGYLSIPVGLAGWFMGKKNKPKMLLFSPDIEPGLALKLLARIADQIAVTVADARIYLPRSKPITVTGYPIRFELNRWASKSNRKEKALSIFKLSDQLPVILVFGGSKGARSINNAIRMILPTLLEKTQIIHICGESDWEEHQIFLEKIKLSLSEEYFLRYCLYPYLHEEMGAAFACADLVISRAGAASLGELPLFGVPSILIPYPHSWQYQNINARYLEKLGAAYIISDNDLNVQLLLTIDKLFSNPAELEEMGKAMKNLSRPQASYKISEIIRQMGVVGRGA